LEIHHDGEAYEAKISHGTFGTKAIGSKKRRDERRGAERMGDAMLSELSVTVSPERLDEGPPEERACFASIEIRCRNIWLTEGHDGFVNKVRSAPLLSAYHLAEWER
jgi:hypothetical protein